MPGLFIRPQLVARTLLALSLLSGLAAGLVRPAAAQVGSDRYSSIVLDAASGNILSAVNADDYRFPASLTKMMTIYMLFEALRDRRVSLNDAVPVSAWSASMSPTKLGLLPGTYITVEQALLGLVTKSANDAAAALGEMMGGDEDRFAQMMTLRARALGMSRTTFRNASGLPDWSQVTTARDMAILGRRLIQDFPGFYHYFSTPSFQFHGRTIYNHQRLLQSYPGADGLKTGYIEASGYNVVTSALRGDARLVAVVMGGASGGERDLHTASLLDQGFDRMGVPTFMARRDPAPYRLPALISLAQATPQIRVAPPPPLPVQVAEARPMRPRPTRPAEFRPAARRPTEPRPDLRSERPRPVAASRGPIAFYEPPPRVAQVRAGQTRTAHNPVWSRFPG